MTKLNKTNRGLVQRLGRVRLGAAGIELSKKHPLHFGGIFHDYGYHIRHGLSLDDPEDKEEFDKLSNSEKALAARLAKQDTSELLDKEFLRIMLEIIEHRYKGWKKKYYIWLANTFYRITIVWGMLGGW